MGENMPGSAPESAPGSAPEADSADEYPYPCYVYVLGTKDGCRSYVGWTTDVAARLAAHNAGKGAKSTRGRQWRVIHQEAFPNKSDAMSREWYLKRDRAFRKKLLASVEDRSGTGTL